MSAVTTPFVEEVGGSHIAELQKGAEAAQMGQVACPKLPRQGLSPVSTEISGLAICALSSCTAVSVQ